MLCKNQAHELRTPADIIGTECRKCFEGRQSRWKSRRGQAMQLLRGLEQNGIDVTDIETKAEKVAVAIKIFERCGVDPVRAEHILRHNPDQFVQLMTALERL